MITISHLCNCKGDNASKEQRDGQVGDDDSDVEMEGIDMDGDEEEYEKRRNPKMESGGEDEREGRKGDE